MEISLTIVVGLVVAICLFAPRPRLDARTTTTKVPDGKSPQALGDWLTESESNVSNIVPGAEATVEWADASDPRTTSMCFLYIHGFSATRQETTPVTERLATAFGANCVHTRLAGHGVTPGMHATAEDWLQSVTDAWHIAERLGEKVVVVGCSTGAVLSVWLAEQSFTSDRIHAFLFLSPNFRIRKRLAFLLTWPWSHHWVPLLIGREHAVEPPNDQAARYWTARYPIQAVIEMQKTVDWFRRLDLSTFNIPLATMYMKNDDVVDPAAAIRAHEAWGAASKRLIPVTLDGDAVQHVFVGNITAPHRIDWCVEHFEDFLRRLDG